MVAAWEQAGVPAGARMRFTRVRFEELPADRRVVLLAVAGAAMRQGCETASRHSHEIVTQQTQRQVRGA